MVRRGDPRRRRLARQHRPAHAGLRAGDLFPVGPGHGIQQLLQRDAHRRPAGKARTGGPAGGLPRPGALAGPAGGLGADRPLRQPGGPGCRHPGLGLCDPALPPPLDGGNPLAGAEPGGLPAAVSCRGGRPGRAAQRPLEPHPSGALAACGDRGPHTHSGGAGPGRGGALFCPALSRRPAEAGHSPGPGPGSRGGGPSGPDGSASGAVLLRRHRVRQPGGDRLRQPGTLQSERRRAHSGQGPGSDEPALRPAAGEPGGWSASRWGICRPWRAMCCCGS